MEKFMQTGNTNFIYKNELDRACFQHIMAYDKSNSLAKRTESDKALRNKAFKIAIGIAVRVELMLSQIIHSQMNFITKFLEI